MEIMKLVGSAAGKAFGLSLVVGALIMGGYYFVNSSNTAGDHIQNAINDRLEQIDSTTKGVQPVNSPVNNEELEGKDPALDLDKTDTLPIGYPLDNKHQDFNAEADASGA